MEENNEDRLVLLGILFITVFLLFSVYTDIHKKAPTYYDVVYDTSTTLLPSTFIVGGYEGLQEATVKQTDDGRYAYVDNFYPRVINLKTALGLLSTLVERELEFNSREGKATLQFVSHIKNTYLEDTKRDMSYVILTEISKDTATTTVSIKGNTKELTCFEKDSLIIVMSSLSQVRKKNMEKFLDRMNYQSNKPFSIYNITSDTPVLQFIPESKAVKVTREIPEDTSLYETTGQSSIHEALQNINSYKMFSNYLSKYNSYNSMKPDNNLGKLLGGISINGLPEAINYSLSATTGKDKRAVNIQIDFKDNGQLTCDIQDKALSLEVNGTPELVNNIVDYLNIRTSQEYYTHYIDNNGATISNAGSAKYYADYTIAKDKILIEFH